MSGGAEDLDMFGFYQNSQVPGAWMGAAYAFFNSIEGDQKIEQKDSSNSAADSVSLRSLQVGQSPLHDQDPDQGTRRRLEKARLKK